MSDPVSQFAAAAGKEVVVQLGKLVHRVVGPAADELSEWLVTGVRQWRSKNLLAVIAKTEPKLEKIDPTWRSSPRVAATILENASWADADTLQELWSNLLVSSMSADGHSEEALLYAPVLSRLTTVQARILDMALMERSILSDLKPRKDVGEYPLPVWLETTGAKSAEEIGLSVESLVSLRLMQDTDIVSFYVNDPNSKIMVHPTHFAWAFFARVHGHTGPMPGFYRPYHP